MNLSSSLSSLFLLVGLAFLTACEKKSTVPAAQKKDAATATSQQSKLAYVEIDSLLTQYEYCIEQKAILEAKSKQFEAQIAAKMSQMEKAYAQFQQNMQKGAYTSEEQARAAQQRIQKLQQEGAQLEQQLNKKMLDEQTTFNNTLRDSVRSFLNDYNKSFGYELILSKQGDNVLYADKHLDITQAVIEGLNKRYKARKK